ncbi:MAG: hypothetical protein KAX93_05110 [Flavobacterium sp.]|nr:hypothetical protein [Flavobacterium sp.]
MKYLKIIIGSLFLISFSVSAQFNNGYNRRMNSMPSTQQTPTKPSAKEIEENRNEQIEKSMIRLKSDLKLDDLQYIAIKNEVIKSNKEAEILLKSDYSNEDKENQMKAIQENTEKTILGYLNTVQKEKYMALKLEKPMKKEDKKKKKSPKNELESETNN